MPPCSPRRSGRPVQLNENGDIDDSDVQLSHLGDDSPGGARVAGRQTASPSELAALCDMLDAEAVPAAPAPRVLDMPERHAASIAMPTSASQRAPLVPVLSEAEPDKSFAARGGPAHRLRTPARSILVSSSAAASLAPAPPSASLLRGYAAGHGVVFVSPEAAEFNSEAPPSAMVVRMGRSEAKARFKVRHRRRQQLRACLFLVHSMCP